VDAVGFATSTRPPDVSEFQSACLRAMSCDELVAGGYCAAASAFQISNASYQLAVQCQDILPTESMIGGSRSFAQMCMTTTLALSGSAVEEPSTFDLT